MRGRAERTKEIKGSVVHCLNGIAAAGMVGVETDPGASPSSCPFPLLG